MTPPPKPDPKPAPESNRLLHEAVNPAGRPLTAEDLWAIPRVGAPEPAPDGTRAIVPVTTYDLEANEGNTRLWLVSAPGPGSAPHSQVASAPRPLTSADSSASSPRCSPDGARLAFLRKPAKDARPQLYLMPLDGGEAEKVTDMPLGVMDPRWFPDGRKIAFLSPLYSGHPTIEATRTHAEAKEKDPVKAHVTEDRVYRYWDRWLTDGDVPHIFVLDLETRTLRDLTPAGTKSPSKPPTNPTETRWFDLMDPDGQYDISPAGDEIVFSANASTPPHDRLRWALWSAPVAGGEPRLLTPGNPADDVRPRYTPDGRGILFGQQLDPFFYADRVRLVRLDRATGRQETITEAWDRSAGAWEFAQDGELVIEAEDRGRVSLFRLPAAAPGAGQPAAGVPEQIASGGVIGGAALASGRIFYTRQDFSHPPEVFVRPIRSAGSQVGAATGADELRLTHFTDKALEGIARGEVREITFAGAGGAPIQMYVLTPPGGGGGPRPLVHVIHGGPHAITGDQWHPRWNAQLFAAPGYRVACVNFHGSTSFGQEFARCIQGGWGDRPAADIEAATDWLIAAGFADAKRMAIIGGSYGGYLVSWIGAQTNRYACIVNHAGVYDLLGQYATDITQGRHASFGGEPWDGLERIDRWSPSRFAKGLWTPMLVVHGERDYRVPVFHGLEVYNVLKAKGVEARLVYFPDENHWVLKPRNSVFWYREVHDWLARFLRRNP